MKTLSIIFISFVALVNIYGQEMKTEKITIVHKNKTTSQVHILTPSDMSEYSYKITVIGGNISLSEVVKTTYFPKDITSYKLSDGRTYFSTELSPEFENETVFLEEILDDGNITVYSYLYKDYKKPILFLKEMGKPIVQIDKNAEPVKTYLVSKSSSCENLTTSDFDRMKANQNDIINYHKATTDCNPRFIKRKTRLGLVAGFRYIETKYEKGEYYTKSKTVEGEEDYKTKVGPAIGIFLDVPFSHKSFSFHPELIYQLEFNDYIINGDRHTLTVPLKIRYTHLKSNGNNLPYIEAGAGAGYVLSGIKKQPVSIADTSYYEENDLEVPSFNYDNISRIFYVVTLGAGIEISSIKKHPICLGLNYMYTNTDKIKSHNFLLNASIAIF